MNKRKKDLVTSKRGYLMYKIRYIGYDGEVPEWQIFTDTTRYLDLVANYHYQHPNRAGPHRTFITPED